ncbi:similar to Saccharomyces cerevisiae YMR311C GLC8 Regulatory subunit of protein phosphatase 1 (Glc7p), involved in glycogen metabolism and chromosome segregation [Maudiozyma saulgeensis]|uniref:Similar to Saccharomyces cerevisiae YMR311C GLC8 Regulatory subunit of protein phosphatase 1 (Glc7p), involved in glycogen metabolism and chromosome segregation n=1 Tax=Maudiozyma saulgeensis TaxID=1789683 RepID=A0A1X7R404_9SACH|nr:similar to Saccharomyces cerevisiae YMR311C GLC8 Regulatory subunit of protein phosphatase 1 (Glc7p), involved in glycogen metabolism and chromosome segregation [Kazachstania saulgeensis]
MGGILKNPLSKDEVNHKDDSETVSEFRKQVYKNTQLNAKLTSGQGITTLNQPFDGDNIKDYPSDMDEKDIAINSKGNAFRRTPPSGPPKDVLQLKKEEEERLQWNKRNLAENEVTKQQYSDIHIDEPKTPYQGAVDPQGEYYRDDDDEDNNEDNNNDDGTHRVGGLPNVSDLDDFTLGEPEYDLKDTADNNDVEVHMADDNDGNEDVESEDELDEAKAKELRHKKFEEMRKKHYDLREMFKSKKMNDEEDEEEEDDNEQ